MWPEITYTEMHQHLVRLGIWAVFSILLGAFLLVKYRTSLDRQHFSLQAISWGIIDGVIVLVGLYNQTLPNLADIAKLREFLWLNEGLDIGYVGVGITLILWGSRTVAPSLSLKGAGLGVVLQGLVLLILDSILIWKLPSIANLYFGHA